MKLKSDDPNIKIRGQEPHIDEVSVVTFFIFIIILIFVLINGGLY